MSSARLTAVTTLRRFIAALPSILAVCVLLRHGAAAQTPRHVRALPHLPPVAIGSYVGIVLAFPVKGGRRRGVVCDFCDRALYKGRSRYRAENKEVPGVGPDVATVGRRAGSCDRDYFLRVFHVHHSDGRSQSLFELNATTCYEAERAALGCLRRTLYYNRMDTVEKAAERWRKPLERNCPIGLAIMMVTRQRRLERHETQARRRWPRSTPLSARAPSNY